MSTRFFYVDESYDANVFCLSALGIRDRDWKPCFDIVREFRRQIKQRFGILLHRELHAHELVSGRGRLGANIVTKRDRNIVYREFLQIATKLPSAMLFNICLEKRKHKDVQMAAWDRLMNRIERTMKRFEDAEAETRATLVDQCRKHALDGEVLNAIEQRLSAYKSRAYVIADQGREEEITRALRKMRVFNPIPSQFGQWSSGATTRNIVTDRVIEDPSFKESHRSYFVQLADCIAFALLKRESPAQTKLVQRYRLDKAFDETVAGICYRQASRDDPLGIVRK